MMAIGKKRDWFSIRLNVVEHRILNTVRKGSTSLEIRKLNSLRGLAALIVLLTHFSDASGWLDGRFGGRSGQYGVMLFFLLSGFLMSYLYLGKRFEKSAIKDYIVARTARVIPLFILILLTSFALESYGSNGLYAISNWQILLSHLLFIDGESVLWTIAPEIQFYLLFIGVWFLASWRPGYIYLLIFCTLIGLFLLNFPRPTGKIFSLTFDFHLFRSLPYFCIGLLFGMHYKSLVVPDYLKNNWFVLVLLLIPLMYPKITNVTSDATYRMWLSYEVLMVMSAIFFTILFLVPDSNILLSNPIGDFIGKISYSLYLLHMPILPLFEHWTISLELKLLLFILLSILIASVSFYLLERPAAKILNKLNR